VKSPIAPASSGFANYALELLSPLGRVSARRFFGGHGFLVDGHMFAFVSKDVLYLKVDEQTKAHFEAAGSKPFVYEAKGNKRVSVNYASMPEEAVESPALALPWARMAFEAALRKAGSKPVGPKKSAKTKARSEPAGAKRRASNTGRAKAAKNSTSTISSSRTAKAARGTARKTAKAKPAKRTIKRVAK
jgi:DNA transformation protein